MQVATFFTVFPFGSSMGVFCPASSLAGVLSVSDFEIPKIILQGNAVNSSG